MPRVNWAKKQNPHRWETTIRPYADDTGFLIDAKFDNIAKLENHTLCSSVLFLDGRERVLSVSPLLRKLVTATNFGKTQVRRDSTHVRMTPLDMTRVEYVEIAHDRCPSAVDLLRRLEEIAEASESVAEISANWSSATGGSIPQVPQ